MILTSSTRFSSITPSPTPVKSTPSSFPSVENHTYQPVNSIPGLYFCAATPANKHNFSFKLYGNDLEGVLHTSVTSTKAKLKTPNGQLLANIDLEGNYTLKDGFRGNLFEDSQLLIEPLLYRPPNTPWVNKILERSNRIAAENSMVPWVKDTSPLRGAKSHIWLIESEAVHAQLMESAILGHRYGIAPEAKTQVFLTEGSQFNPNQYNIMSGQLSDFENTVKGFFGHEAIRYLKQLQNAHQKLPQDNSTKILNFSDSLSRIDMYQEFQTYILPGLTEIIHYSPTPSQELQDLHHRLTSGSDVDKLQALINFCDPLIENNPQLESTIDTFNKLATEMQEKQNVLLLMPSGNEHNRLLPGLALKDDAEWNILSKTPAVFTIAGSATRQSPSDFSKHTVASSSSRGYKTPEGTHIPMVTSPGQWLMTDFLPCVSGTSIATAFSSGVCALMLEANPRLNAEQLADLLIQSSENPNHIPSEMVGAGFLNPLKAIELALAA